MNAQSHMRRQQSGARPEWARPAGAAALEGVQTVEAASQILWDCLADVEVDDCTAVSL